jgi:outer membrane protein TolC
MEVSSREANCKSEVLVNSFYLIVLFIALLMSATKVHGKEIFSLSEKSLEEVAKQSSYQIQELQAVKDMALFQDSTKNESYQWKWKSEVSHSNSNEKALANFFPTFGPTYRFQTGIQKKTKKGIDFNVDVFVDQQSTKDKFIDQATRTGYMVGFSIDLWKNLLGRIDSAELKDSEFLKKKSVIEADISKKVVIVELKKLYWSIIANDRKLQISNQLLLTSQKQLKDAQKRGSQYIADKAEIARYRAQVSSRRSSIKSLEYQRDLLIQNLKMALPNIANLNIQLAPIDLNKSYAKVYQCAERIGRIPEVPWASTQIDDMVELVEKSYRQKKLMTSRYSDLDVKLSSQIQSSGVDKGYENSFDDFSNNSQFGYQVGVSITMPLGSTADKSKASKESADFNRFLSEKSRLLGQVQAKHYQITKMVKLLEEAVKSIRNNSNNLAISIKSSRNKLRQARISINDLLSEQDAFFNSKLSEIDTILQVIHTLLDYHQTFTEDKCNTLMIGAR